MSDPPKLPERNLHILEAGQQAPHDRPKERTFATIGSEIKCDKDIFDSYSYDGWKDIHHDLLIVCAAVEYADRRWARSAYHWSRSISVTIPVLELATWLDAHVQQNLRDTLRHLTGDEWQFTFIQNGSGGTDKPRQRPLFPQQDKKFAIAYSEGLDSLCISGLYNENDEAVCVRVAKHKQRRRKDERPFDRLPFDVIVKQNAEYSVRSRGFKFASITAIAANLAKVSRIVVPESGQGALGPVLLPLRNIYPDYRNHPTFFRRMERFIQVLLGAEITFEQPRLWHTKGQTVAAFLAKSGTKQEQVFDTCPKSEFADHLQREIGMRLNEGEATQEAINNGMDAALENGIGEFRTRTHEACLEARSSGEMRKDQFDRFVEGSNKALQGIDRVRIMEALKQGNKSAFKHDLKKKEGLDEGPKL